MRGVDSGKFFYLFVFAVFFVILFVASVSTKEIWVVRIQSFVAGMVFISFIYRLIDYLLG